MTTKHDRCTVGEVMTSRVHTGSPDQSLESISRLLVKERCHHLPIVEGGQPVGMISASDLLRLARGSVSKPHEKGSLEGKCASDVMTTPLETIDGDESVDDAIARIGRGGFHALIVVDEAGDLAVIVTHHDLLDYLMG